MKQVGEALTFEEGNYQEQEFTIYILCVLVLYHIKVFPLNANLTDRSNMGRLSQFPATY